jgi:hypothetical protein
MKMKLLADVGCHPSQGTCGVYIDDQTRFVEMPDGWTFVHYVGQTAAELHEEVLCRSSA